MKHIEMLAVGVGVLTLELLTGCGGAARADGKQADKLDRRAPDSQRELTRIVDAFYDGLTAIDNDKFGNPIQIKNQQIHERQLHEKLWADFSTVMRKSGGRFDGWIGTISFPVNVTVADDKPVDVSFIPDGILERSTIPGPVKYSGPLFVYRTGIYSITNGSGAKKTEDSRPLWASPVGQSLGTIDMKRKVKASGELVMTDQPPGGKPGAPWIPFHFLEFSNPYSLSGPCPLAVRLTAVSNL